jgi:FAD:protein FMN transferase
MAPALPLRSSVRTARDGVTVARLRIAMGTSLAIEATAESEETARIAIEAAFDAVADVEARMHPRRPGSDVARINAAAAPSVIRVHASTWEVLELARRLHTLSDGVFDPCTPVKSGRLADLELGRGPWVIAHAPVALDLGGIAKGHAVDRALGALKDGGCSVGLVNAGGDLRVFGPRPRPLLLRRSDGGCEPLALLDSALAVSEPDRAQRPSEHLGYYSRVGAVRRLRPFAAVMAPQAVLADALTKCALLCPPEVVRRITRAFGPGVESVCEGSRRCLETTPAGPHLVPISAGEFLP